MARDLYTDLGSNLDIAPVKSRIWMFEIQEQVVLQRESLCVNQDCISGYVGV